MRRPVTVALVTASLLLSSGFFPASAAPIVLDDFSAFPGTWSVSTGPGVLQTNAIRTLTLGPPGLVNPGDAISINTVAQQFIVAHSPISTSNWAVTLSYNVSGSFSPSNQILLYFDSLDLNMLITLTVTTTSGNLTATYNIVTPGPTLDFTVALPFSSLAGPGNLANTTGISITFNSGNIPDVDFVLFGKDRGIQLTW